VSGPDVEGVLGRHVLTNSFTTIEGHKAASCSCGEAAFPVDWLGMRWEVEARLHRAHVAAALRAEVRAWLESEGARLAAAEGVEDYAYPGLSVIECERAAKSALAALAEQVGQVASVGEGEGS
jgi:hypothetical protein